MYLILDGISPENHLEIIVVVHPHCNASVLRSNQSAQAVAMDVTYYQVSSIRKNDRRNTSCKNKNKKEPEKLQNTGSHRNH